MPLRLAIAGIAGRMGREVLAVAAAEPAVTVVGGTVRPGSAAAGQDWATVTGVALPKARIADNPVDLLGESDVLIDFTRPDAAVNHAHACAAAGVAFVSGTTGLSPEQLAELHATAARVP